MKFHFFILLGPLMSRMDGKESYQLDGIVSFGLECATPGSPGFYTRVTSFMEWIGNNIGDEEELCQPCLKGMNGGCIDLKF